MSTPRLAALALSLAIAGAAVPARAQDVGDGQTAGADDEATTAAEALRLKRARAAAAEPAPDAAAGADPYPLADAGTAPDDGLGVPGDDAADPSLPPVTGSLPIAPTPSALGLRPSTSAVAPLTSVVRPADRSGVAALPVTGAPPLARDAEQEARSAYDPVGLRVGSFVAAGSVTAGVGYSSNAAESAGGSGSAYYLTRGSLALRSDWERHGFDVVANGGLRRYADESMSLEPNADVTATARLDLTETDRVAASAGWTYSRETGSSAELGTKSTGADVHTLSGTLGYERNAGLIGLALKGAVDRTSYEAGESRSNTAVSGSLRLTLENGAALRPFVEGGGFTRRYDDEVDGSGYARDSVGWELKTGLVVDTGLLTGEASVGYALERPEDDRLDDIAGFTADAGLAWTPTELVTVGLKGTTTFEPSQIAGASGSVKHAVDVDVAYALQPNVILNTGAGFSYQDYTGVSRTVETFAVRAGAEWRVNRTVSLGLTGSHARTNSSVAGESYDESRIEATVTLRR